VKSPKHDARDAEAICEAVTRPTMRVVPIKRVEPQDIQALHRVRERLMKARTALVNEIRGLLSESGMIMPPGIPKFRRLLVQTLEAGQAQLTPCSCGLYTYALALLPPRRRQAHENKTARMQRCNPVGGTLLARQKLGPRQQAG
jgi:transposase